MTSLDLTPIISPLEAANTALQEDNLEKATADLVLAILEARRCSDQIKSLHDQARDLLIVTLTRLETDQVDLPFGRVYTTRPSINVTYNPEGIDALIASNPHLKPLLEPHRQQKERAGYLVVKAKGGHNG